MELILIILLCIALLFAVPFGLLYAMAFMVAFFARMAAYYTEGRRALAIFIVAGMLLNIILFVVALRLPS